MWQGIWACLPACMLYSFNDIYRCGGLHTNRLAPCHLHRTDIGSRVWGLTRWHHIWVGRPKKCWPCPPLLPTDGSITDCERQPWKSPTPSFLHHFPHHFPHVAQELYLPHATWREGAHDTGHDKSQLNARHSNPYYRLFAEPSSRKAGACSMRTSRQECSHCICGMAKMIDWLKLCSASACHVIFCKLAPVAFVKVGGNCATVHWSTSHQSWRAHRLVSIRAVTPRVRADPLFLLPALKLIVVDITWSRPVSPPSLYSGLPRQPLSLSRCMGGGEGGGGIQYRPLASVLSKINRQVNRLIYMCVYLC